MVNAVDNNGDGIIDDQGAQSLVDVVNQANGSSLSAEDCMGQFDTDEDGTFTVERVIAGLEVNRPERPASPPESRDRNTGRPCRLFP